MDVNIEFPRKDKKVAFIGLGRMGIPMASNLVLKGYDLSVLNRTRSKMDALVSLGAYALGDALEAIEKNDVVVMSLTNDDVMKDVVAQMLGKNDLHGKVIIDTTSARFSTTIEMARQVKEKGGYFLDSPVTGGEFGARKGTLSFMVGGDKEAFESVYDIFQAMGNNIVYIGKSGNGQLTKMINQSLMNAMYCSIAENFAFAAQRGIDRAKIYEAIEFGGAKSGLLSSMKETILSGEPVENNNLAIMGKDADYLTEECNRKQCFMPIQAASQGILNTGRKLGFSKFWTGCLYMIWERLFGFTMTL